MKLSIARDLLAPALAAVSTVSTRSTVSFMECVRIEARASVLNLTCTELDQRLDVVVADARVETEGSVCVDINRARALVASWQSGFSVDVSVDGVGAHIRCRNSRLIFPVLAATEFPRIAFTGTVEIEISAETIAKIGAVILPLIESDGAHVALAGAHISARSGFLRAVGANPHRI